MPQNTYVESFLEMLVVERGVTETTRVPFKNPADLDQMSEDLRKAGLPQ